MINLMPYTPIANKPLIQQKPVAFGSLYKDEVEERKKYRAENYIALTQPENINSKGNLLEYMSVASVFINAPETEKAKSARACQVARTLTASAQCHKEKENTEMMEETYEAAIALLVDRLDSCNYAK